MRPDRWQKIDEIFHAALQHTPEERKAFIETACSGDEELRRELESLLAEERGADGFIEQPAMDVVAKDLAAEQKGSQTGIPSWVGKTLGAYQILSLLGSGGMGEVYKARDSKLNRSVAIKVLPPDKTSDADRKRRFVQEARAASALSHPNIITIHDIGREDDIDFIVMEYVAGKTLDRLIPRGGLKLKEVLKYSLQVADGLAKAHSAGIIHRDLKPGNVMVTEDGLVKVLDFGLAKLTEKAMEENSSATGTRQNTEPGTVMGTVSYMSPEQAEGKDVDARSDIFSLGSLLYEMVTGQPAFHRDSAASTLAVILKEEPKPIGNLVPGIPSDLEKIIGRCLRKDPARRFQHMDDLKVELADLKEESDSRALTGTDPARPALQSSALHFQAVSLARQPWLWLGAALVVLAMAVGVWLNRSAAKVAEAPLTVVPLTSYPGEEKQACFSPDGNQVAFSWNGKKQDNFDIYVKFIGSDESLRLTRTPEADTYPAWSPDGRSIAFIRDRPGGKPLVYLGSPLGPPDTERNVAEVSVVSKLAWTPDGKSLVVTDRNSDNEPLGLFLLSVESRSKQRLTSPPDKRVSVAQPAFSPDGRSLAFAGRLGPAVSDIYLLTLSEYFQPIEEPKRLTLENRGAGSPAWTSDGREIIFDSRQSIWGIYSLFRIAASSSGKPQRLATGGEDGSEPAISRRTQRLVYTRNLNDANIWRVEVPGPHGKTSPPKKLISSTRLDMAAQFSPEGKRIAFASNRSGSEEIWVSDNEGLNAQQLTFLGLGGDPRWSPDGERIAFVSNVNGQWEIYVISANGGKPECLTNNPADDRVPSWSRDGKWIYFASDRGGKQQAWKMPAAGGEAIRLTRQGGYASFESPDGQWVYYLKAYDDSSLWKVPRDGGEETTVLESVTRRNLAIVDEGIYFIPRPNSEGHYSIQLFNFATKKSRSIITIEKPVSQGLSVSSDGRWILFTQMDQTGSDLMLVENLR